MGSTVNRDEVLRAISEAFNDAIMPRTEAELAPPSIDAPYAIKHFLGRTRSDVETQPFLSSLHMEDFTYMTDGAALYYLPSVLRIQLADVTDAELWIFLRGFLNHIDGKYPYPGLGVLSTAQRRAIADWAELLGSEWAVHDWMSKWSDEAVKLARKYRVAPPSGSGE